MSKLDNEFKNEFDKNFREGSYIIRKFLIAILIIVLVFGIFGVGYTFTVGKFQKNAEREVFKNSTAYTEQASSYLAKSYKEYNQADSKEEKNAIMKYVIIKYPNLDINSIDNSKLKYFYEKCLEN